MKKETLCNYANITRSYHVKKTLSVLSVVLVTACSSGPEAYKSKGEKWDDRNALSEIKYNVGRVDRAGGVHIAIDRGIFQLSGFVESEAIKTGVERETLKTRDVKNVINSIIVRGDPAYRVERAAAAVLDVK